MKFSSLRLIYLHLDYQRASFAVVVAVAVVRQSGFARSGNRTVTYLKQMPSRGQHTKEAVRFVMEAMSSIVILLGAFHPPTMVEEPLSVFEGGSVAVGSLVLSCVVAPHVA